jgi:hypothetical protein
MKEMQISHILFRKRGLFMYAVEYTKASSNLPTKKVSPALE